VWADEVLQMIQIEKLTIWEAKEAVRPELGREPEEEGRRGCDEGGKEELGGEITVPPSPGPGTEEVLKSNLFEPALDQLGYRCSILGRGRGSEEEEPGERERG